jgi:hypothetical protein
VIQSRVSLLPYSLSFVFEKGRGGGGDVRMRWRWSCHEILENSAPPPRLCSCKTFISINFTTTTQPPYLRCTFLISSAPRRSPLYASVYKMPPPSKILLPLSSNFMWKLEQTRSCGRDGCAAVLSHRHDRAGNFGDGVRTDESIRYKGFLLPL